MIERIDWCDLCQSRPSDGILTILIDNVPENVNACEICVNDKDKVKFI